MLKKIVCYVIVLSMLLCLMPSMANAAKVGDVIGEALHTDIVAYINHYAIPSYAVNGTSCIVAEDLRNYCFDVNWSSSAKSLYIVKNAQTTPKGMTFKKTGKPGTKFTDLLKTDISVYANGKKLTSYAINGYTMIPIEELTVFGECHWVSGERAIKLWVDGVKCLANRQIVPVDIPKTTSYGLPVDTYFEANVMKEGMFNLESMVRHYSHLGFSIEYPMDYERHYSGNSLTIGWPYANSTYLTITKYTDWTAESMKNKLLKEVPGTSVNIWELDGKRCYALYTPVNYSKRYPSVRNFFLIEHNGVLYLAETNHSVEAWEGVGADFGWAIDSLKFF